ncbi:MAG TPA: AIR carboxylase family protein, partial [Nitrospirota bacterium]
RTPERAHLFATTAAERGLKVIIAGAGGAAHLAGVIAANTTLPVIGVPIDSSTLQGIDALLSTAQMPGGIPVATMAIGKAGAKNAGIFAAQIIGTADVKVANRLKVFKVEMERDVEEKGKRLLALTSFTAQTKVSAPVRVSATVREEEPEAEVSPAKKKPRRRRWKKKSGGSTQGQGPAS